MGMAITETYPRPKVKKVAGEWRVYWCDVHNRLWYMPRYDWREAMTYALRIK
jgi:hypothetical protein